MTDVPLCCLRALLPFLLAITTMCCGLPRTGVCYDTSAGHSAEKGEFMQFGLESNCMAVWWKVLGPDPKIQLHRANMCTSDGELAITFP